MGSNRKLIFGAALVVAALAFWGLMTALNSVNRIAAKPTPAAAVSPQQVALQRGRLIAYAASEIPQGTLVTKNMLRMKTLQGDGPTTSFITDPDTQAVGFVTNTRILKDAIIRPGEDFAGHISDVGLAGMLQPNMRAIVIPFANKPTLHDLVAIGNHVDINAAFDGQEARTIVPDVRVLAVDVFGSDFPQVNIARRGAYKAETQAAAPVVGAPGAPGATPTPTPAPGQGAARPDPAITLEVTPEQANRILLAQASGGVLDFVVLPARNAVLVGNPSPGLPGDQLGALGGLTTISTVTKPQLAPYAERKKAAGGSSNPTRVAAADRPARRGSGGSDDNPAPRRFPRQPVPNFDNVSTPPAPVPLPDSGNQGIPAPPAESPTYNIPIYADGRAVRVETVQRPQQ